MPSKNKKCRCGFRRFLGHNFLENIREKNPCPTGIGQKYDPPDVFYTIPSPTGKENGFSHRKIEAKIDKVGGEYTYVHIGSPFAGPS